MKEGRTKYEKSFAATNEELEILKELLENLGISVSYQFTPKIYRFN